jgi:hypothetical protein
MRDDRNLTRKHESQVWSDTYGWIHPSVIEEMEKDGNPEMWAAVIAACERFGLQVQNVGELYDDGPAVIGFDGRTIDATHLGVGDVLHELAHFLIADPDRRNLPDYGLGPTPSNLKAFVNTPMIVDERADREREEWMACFATIGLAHGLGLTGAAIRETAYQCKLLGGYLDYLAIHGNTWIDLCKRMDIEEIRAFTLATVPKWDGRGFRPINS